MNEPKVKPKFSKTIIGLRALFAVIILLMSVAINVSFYTQKTHFEQDLYHSKMQWQTKVLPADEVITIQLLPTQGFLDFGIQSPYLLLKAYRDKVSFSPMPKEYPLIYSQKVFLNQAILPQELSQPTVFYLNNVVLLHADTAKDLQGRTIDFLQQATIEQPQENANSQSIGKPIVTGITFNQALAEDNLERFLFYSKSLIAFLMTILILIFIQFRKKFNLFEKSVLLYIIGYYGLITAEVITKIF